MMQLGVLQLEPLLATRQLAPQLRALDQVKLASRFRPRDPVCGGALSVAQELKARWHALRCCALVGG